MIVRLILKIRVEEKQMKRVLTKVIYVVVVVLAILIYISAISYITSAMATLLLKRIKASG